ncbi:MAG: HAD family phosphatase [Bacteroidota bacterium]
MPNIRNLLIDLGDVLYAINPQHTQKRWQAMASEQGGVAFTKEQQHDLFCQLDKGEIEIEDLADGLIQAYQLQAPREDVILAWKELLTGVIPGRVEAISKLKAAGYKMALLSNTNRYHHSVFKDECEPIFRQLDHVFLSFEMGMRKPDAEIYLTALETAGWKAEETLFLDDSRPNIEGAAAVGIQTWHVAEYADFDRMCAQYLP